MKIILETSRTYLRELNSNDAQHFYQLNLDNNVIKFTGDLPFKDVDEAKKFIQNYTHYQHYGYGRWAVVEKSSNQFIGWCGLRYSPQTQDTDIGFRFYKQYWNKGFATETAKAVLDYGFLHFNLKKIIGRAMKQNAASIKVLQKIGMIYIGETLCDLHNAQLFEITQPQ